MVFSMFLCGATLVGLPATDKPPAKPQNLEAYAAAKGKAGQSAEAQVKLALWCEARGLSAERTKHLILATLIDPLQATARGLLGLVSYQGKWQSPDEVARRVQEDPVRTARLQDYLQRRARTPDKADDQWKLALWCEENGLKEQATAHLYQVLRHEPGREAAWKRLGFKKAGRRWVKPDLLATAKAESEAQARATKLWKPKLERWRDGLGGRDKAKKTAAEEGLGQITDQFAVPSVMSVFGRGSEVQQRVALKTLSQIDAPGASRSLAMLAVFCGSAAIRGEAIAILRRRDPREFADFLINLVMQPIEFEVKQVRGPGSSGELLIKGQGSQPNLRRIYSPPAAPDVPLQPGDRLVYDGSGMPVIRRPVVGGAFAGMTGVYNTNWLSFGQMEQLGLWRNPPLDESQKQHFMTMMAQSGLGPRGQQVGQQLLTVYRNQVNFDPTPYQLVQETGYPIYPNTFIKNVIGAGVEIPIGRMAVEAQTTAVAAGQQLDRDVQSIRDYNSSLRELDDRVVPVLQDISGLDLGTKKQEWQNWFIDQVGFQAVSTRTTPPPTMVEDVPLDYQPREIPLSSFVGPIAVQRISCFGAGTPVHTLSGPRPIQDLTVGDQVLTQNTRTGALDYHPVLVVHHNPPSRTFKVALGGEIIVSSAFHRFWKAGQGWVMARDLEVGDRIRTLNGTVKVARIEEGQVVPVFNLDVAADADFFVGRLAALVHDNTLPDLRQSPFDGLGSTSTDGDTGSRPAERSSRSSGSPRP